MRVGIVSLMHESNTFIKSPTTLQHFRDDLLLQGEAIGQQLASSHHEIGGFFGGLELAGIEAVPIFAARAIPYGPIAAESFEYLAHALTEGIAVAGPLDGLLVALHGAAVSEVFRDADGQVLSRIREVFGADRPLIMTLDPHANVSQRMVYQCDGIIAYRTNPHIDQRERGVEAAQLMSRTLRGEIRPVVRASLPPLVINIERQCTSEPQFDTIHEAANNIRHRPNFLSVSVVLGFPYADVEEMGASTLVVADRDEALAQSAADELAGKMWEQRYDFVGQYISIDEAIERAVTLPGPVCLLDMGDNTGGGSPANGTWLAHALLKKRIRSFVCIYDPIAVRAAVNAQGAELQLDIGGKTDLRHGPPLCGRFLVERIHDGRFEETQVRHGGWRFFDQGLTAIVSHPDGLTVMVNSHRMPPFSLQQLLSCGINPADYQVIVAKGVNAPLAAYREVCPHLLRVDTPGVTTANLERLEFHHRRRPMYPFEE